MTRIHVLKVYTIVAGSAPGPPGPPGVPGTGLGGAARVDDKQSTLSRWGKCTDEECMKIAMIMN